MCPLGLAATDGSTTVRGGGALPILKQPLPFGQPPYLWAWLFIGPLLLPPASPRKLSLSPGCFQSQSPGVGCPDEGLIKILLITWFMTLEEKGLGLSYC